MRLFARLAAAALLAALASAARAAEPLRLTLFHTNDVHGWIAARPAEFFKADPRRLIGGMPALANWVRSEKGPKLLLDAGDWFQGAPEGLLTQGRAVAECMNAVGYDAVTVGNHDFDFGQDVLRERIAELKMPALGANIHRESGGLLPGVRPYVLKEVAGIKVGIFGLLSSNRKINFEKNYAGLDLRREVDEARERVRELKEKGATVIVALTHIGSGVHNIPEDDFFLAEEVPGIDVVIGGHTHRAFNPPLRSPKHGTLIAQAGSYLTRAGRIDLEIDPETKRVLRSTGMLRDLWVDELGQAADILEIVEGVERRIASELDVVVGTSAALLTRDDSEESLLGSWAMDCQREWAGSDVALQNSSGFRGNLPRGPVTRRHIFHIMPFDNTVATLSVTGAQLERALENGLGIAPTLNQVSGLRMEYAPSASPGRRLRKVWVGGEPLRGDAWYTVAVSNFLLDGGDGYGVFKEGRGRTDTLVLVRDVLVQCVARHSPVGPPALGRVVPKD